MVRVAVVFLLYAASTCNQTIEFCCSVNVRVRTADGTPVPRAAIRIESGAIKYVSQTAENGDAVVTLRTPGHVPGHCIGRGLCLRNQAIQHRAR